MLIVKSGLPGNPLQRIPMHQSQALFVATALTLEGASYYYEPYPDGDCIIAVDPEHAGRVRQILEPQMEH